MLKTATISSLLFSIKQKMVNGTSAQVEGEASKEGLLLERQKRKASTSHTKGRKCLLCRLMSNTSSVSAVGKKIQCDGGDCKSRNIPVCLQVVRIVLRWLN